MIANNGLMRALLTLIACCAFHGTPTFAQSKTITILEWNIEAGGSDVDTILGQLDKLGPFDVVALSEVANDAVDRFAKRWSSDSSLVGTAGGGSKLLIAWNPTVLEKLEASEMKQVEGQEFAPGIQPAPLAIKFKHKSTSREFIVISSHLARGSAELRKKQALLLVDWARHQSMPVIGVGGYNFDYDFTTSKGNESFDAFLADDTWKWIKPKSWVDTNWADRNRDGKDDYPNSMLSYTFVSGPAKSWNVTSEVVVRDGDFPDTDKTSDHRPIRCVVELP